MSASDEPLASIIIPTYNKGDRSDFLLDAVDSACNQTYDNIEVLVIDDHSPVPAQEKLKNKTDNKFITIIRHDENKGANAARNTGIRNASGEFIAFLDDDDRWVETKIERQIEVFQNTDDKVGVVYTGQRSINENGDTTSLKLEETSGNVTKKLLYGKNTAPFSSIMVRADVIDDAGLPDTRFPTWQDREWCIRLSQHCKFKSIPEPLVIRRRGSYEKISSNYKQKRDVTYPLFLEKYRRVAAQYGWLSERKMVSATSQKMGIMALITGEYQDSRKFLTKSLRNYPFFFTTYLYLAIACCGRKGRNTARKIKRIYEQKFERSVPF